MRRRFLAVAVLCLFPVTSAFTQIVLTENSFPRPGLEYSTHMTGFDPVPVENGLPGINQTWTFGSFNWFYSMSSIYADPDSTPYGSSFPTAAQAVHGLDVPDTSDVFSYYRATPSAYYYLGLGSHDTVTVYADPRLVMTLPCTYQSSWTVDIHVDRPNYTMRDSIVHTIDGWGTITTPYGTYPCLRDFNHQWYYSRYGTFPPTEIQTVGYLWISDKGMPLVNVYSEEDITDPNFSQGFVEMLEVAPETSVITQRGPVAATFAVKQNYPNPFNPTTELPIELQAETRITVDIYDANGRLVSSDKYLLPAGKHDLPINGSQWATGTYFARVQALHELQTVKMQLIK